MVNMEEFDISAINKKRSVRMSHRLLNRIYALVFGYFWKPCPICGKMFGGHESSNGFSNAIPDKYDKRVGDIICPDCARDGRGTY